jgi:hypothetical protein
MFIATKPVIAVLTLKAIDNALERDQGAAFRRELKIALPLAEDVYREETDVFRSHLGASIIGKECARELWYTFHWSAIVRHSGRMLRLFNRGHMEEPRFVALMRMIGCEVWQHASNGSQFRTASHMDHFGGSLDCVVRGIPDDPYRPLLGEFKTHSSKSFEKLQTKGVRESKFAHYVQMQIYMGGLNLERAIYLAVNKDNDELYPELVNFDQETFRKYSERGREIIFLNKTPPRINSSPGWYACKFCDFRQQCHFGEPLARNCRTCIYSKPQEKGEWFCSRHGTKLTKSDQLAGCPDYNTRAE